MSAYPDRWHPVYFLQDALTQVGVKAEFAKDGRTRDCWGLILPDFRKVMVWLIDNRLPHEQMKEDPAAKALLDEGALVCHAQKGDMARVGGHWLPLAASPGFEAVSVAKTSDVAFVGYVRDEGRAHLLASVGKKYKLSLNQGLFGRRAVEAYCGAHVGLNIPSHYGQPYCTDINMRVFEIAACGVPLVTNALPELAELGFVDQKTCVTYGRFPLLDAVLYARSYPEVASAARQLILDRHTYAHRAQQVIQWLSA